MSPIDDELRTALHRRADAPGLVPADPFAGIERRARGMRRRRAGAAVTGSALAVALIAVGASTLGGSTLVATPDGGFATEAPATASPSPEPEPQPAAPYALDPADPWAYRGDPAVRGDGFEETVAREYAIKHPGYESITPLFGQVYEPAAFGELVFVSSEAGDGGGPARWGVAQATESGPQFVVDEALPPGGTNALVAALAGDERARLLVLVAPLEAEVAYLPDGTTSEAMTSLARGVFTHPLDGNSGTDRVRVNAGDFIIHDDDAPEAPGFETGAGEQPGAGPSPENVLADWPERGTPDAALLEAAVAAYASGKSGAAVSSRVLFTGADDAGNRYLLAQMWTDDGGLADTVGYVERPGSEPELQLKTRATPDQPVLAMLVTAAPGQSVDTLVVVPRPRTGQVLYGDPASEFRPITGQDFLDGVVLIDRRQTAAGEGGDKLQLLDGNGVQYFEGLVTDLLCGVTSCS